MVQTIVVPLDGSPLSETALAPARWLATNLDADVHLIVTTLDPDVAPHELYLEATQATFGIERVSTYVLPHVFPAPGILAHVGQQPDALLCMATHGHSGLSAIVLGSVAELVVRDATEPVVLCGPECAPMALVPGPLVWCWDGSTTSLTAAPFAASLAASLGVEARIVMVRETDDADYDRSVSTERQTELDRLREQFAAGGATATTAVLDSPKAASAIVDYASSSGASLIVTATHGQGGLLNGATGRVAAKLVQRGPCPVIVRRPSPAEV